MLPDWCVLLPTDSDEDWIFQAILKIRFLFYFLRVPREIESRILKYRERSGYVIKVGYAELLSARACSSEYIREGWLDLHVISLRTLDAVDGWFRGLFFGCLSSVKSLSFLNLLSVSHWSIFPARAFFFLHEKNASIMGRKMIILEKKNIGRTSGRKYGACLEFVDVIFSFDISRFDKASRIKTNVTDIICKSKIGS